MTKNDIKLLIALAVSAPLIVVASMVVTHYTHTYWPKLDGATMLLLFNPFTLINIVGTPILLIKIWNI